MRSSKQHRERKQACGGGRGAYLRLTRLWAPNELESEIGTRRYLGLAYHKEIEMKATALRN
jgi:hypothetical protein